MHLLNNYSHKVHSESSSPRLTKTSCFYGTNVLAFLKRLGAAQLLPLRNKRKFWRRFLCDLHHLRLMLGKELYIGRPVRMLGHAPCLFIVLE